MSGLTFITAADPRDTGGRSKTTRLRGKTRPPSVFSAEKPATLEKQLVGFSCGYKVFSTMKQTWDKGIFENGQSKIPRNVGKVSAERLQR